ncbi:MBL fold metallo-hydrolase [Haloarchaeobius sp. TZWWS8]|uniref:MBL fold metallo-hydrolase n=1 Tax=Haloarchaeobius sp. TZWWS8 TaxID=3446121 RepID=UPI003EBA3EDA
MNSQQAADGEPSSVSPAELHEWLVRGTPFTALDVRDRDEFEAWHVDGPAVTARQVPHMKFLQAQVKGTAAALVDGLPEPVVVVCAEGEASAHAADLLVDAGVDARNLDGGMDAWASLLVARDLGEDGAVVQYDRPSSGCLSYLVVDGDEAAVVDPLRAFADRYVAEARERGADLRYAIDTHVHADHVSGVRAVALASDAEPVVPELARERGLAFDARPVSDGERLPLGDSELTAVHLPGHTTEMTGLRYDGVLFGGDSLFLDGVARPDLEHGDDGAPDAARRLHQTLHERLLQLPPETRLAPAHYAPGTERAADETVTATLGDLKTRLEALARDEEEFVDHLLADATPRPNEFERIIAVNLGRDSLDEEAAAAIELGPNNCAVSR